MKNYANVLVMLLRLRQVCGHPSLIQEDFLNAAVDDPDAERRLAMNKAKAAMGQDWVIETKKRRLHSAAERVKSGKDGQEVRFLLLHASASALLTGLLRSRPILRNVKSATNLSFLPNLSSLLVDMSSVTTVLKTG